MSDEPKVPAGMDDSEDIFGFDELHATPEPSGEGLVPLFDEEDDLFNFDELGADDETDESVDLDEILAEVPDQSTSDDAEEAPAPALPSGEASESGDDPTDADVLTPSAPRFRMPAAATPRLGLRSLTTWVLVGFTVVNLGLIGLTWRMSSSMSDQVSEVASSIVRATREIQAQTSEHVEKIESVQAPIVASDPSQHTTFSLARRDLEDGDFAGARRRLYSLLAVADRLEPEVRESVEARAHFLLADVALAVAFQSEDENLVQDESEMTSDPESSVAGDELGEATDDVEADTQ